MSVRNWLAGLVGVVLVFGSAVRANAETVVAGVSFDDDAFADSLISSYSAGGFTTFGGTLAAVLTDTTANTWAYSNTSNAGDYVQLGFTDNFIVNGLGDDIALFEIGIADAVPISLTIGGTEVTKTPVDTGFDTTTGDTYNINLAKYDLDDFGLAAGALVSSLVVSFEDQPGGVPGQTIGLVGALNSAPIPEPSTVVGLVSMGFLGALGYVWRRRRRVA